MPEKKTPLKRIVKVEPAYKPRNSARLRMTVAGPLGAVELMVLTGWTLDWKQHSGQSPMAESLGVHSPTPHSDDDPGSYCEKCEYLDGRPCWVQGSGLRADEFFQTLVEKGSDALWEKLENEYTRQFEIPF